jgi:hypothetical protein
MNRGVLIAASLALMLIAAGAGYLIGRRDAPSAGPVTANGAAPASPAAGGAKEAAPAATAPSAAAADADAALSRWIVGGWAEASTNCETDTGEYYDPSGRWASTGQEGRWRIENGRATVTVTHESAGDPMLEDSMRPLPRATTHVTPLRRDGADRMTMIVDGRPVAMMRCPEARYSFST